MLVPWLGPILRGVVAVTDLDRAVAAYRAGLGLVVGEEGALDSQTALRWRAPAAAGADYVVMAPASGRGGALQLVRQPPPPDGYAPLRTPGWAALELAVADVDAVVAKLTSEFTVLRRPAALSGQAGGVIRAAQVLGPGGEVLYLTEIRGELPPFQLPWPPAGDVDGVFIAVLAATDLERSRSWWESALPVHRASDRMAAVAVLNQAFDLPGDRLHRLSSLQLSGRAVVEIDQYPDGAAPRPMHSGHLPPGVAVVVCGAPVPRDDPKVLIGPDRVMLELRSAPRPIDVVTEPT